MGIAFFLLVYCYIIVIIYIFLEFLIRGGINVHIATQSVILNPRTHLCNKSNDKHAKFIRNTNPLVVRDTLKIPAGVNFKNIVRRNKAIDVWILTIFRLIYCVNHPAVICFYLYILFKRCMGYVVSLTIEIPVCYEWDLNYFILYTTAINICHFV